jgi:outer membrane protein assembly factor BamA
VDARVRWINGPVELWTEYRFEDYPQEDFFGVGLSSSLATRTSYDLDTNDISLRGLVKLGDSLRIGTKVGYMNPQVGPGHDRNFPSIERFFTDAEAPGLAAQPNFLHTALFTEVDYRDQRGNAREGGLYRASFGVWDDRTQQQFDFRRLDAQAVHYVPVAPSKKHVVSGQVGLSYVNNKSGNRVPFYFLPYVGGMDSIRSYRDFRFKDENALWINLEYKWTVISYLSLATFFDVGEVQRHWEEIGFGGLKRGYGFGVRFHTPQLDLGRIDVGTGGGEGWRAFVKLGPSF